MTRPDTAKIGPPLPPMPVPASWGGGVTMTYLVLVEVVKRRLMRRLLVMGPASPVAKSVTSAS
jgi:hypothetical protein